MLLFEDARRRNYHKEKLSQTLHDLECTFSPDIKSSKDLLSNRKVQTPHGCKFRNQLSNNELLFQPKINKQTASKRNTNGLPIGEYLFGLQNEKKVKTHPKKIANSSFVQDESNKILENKKTSLFIEFFQAFDNDLDGTISSKNINLTGNNENIQTK